MDPYPSAPSEPSEPRHLSAAARRVDWLVAGACLVLALAVTVVATVLAGVLTSTCSETGDCDESARSVAFGLTPLSLLIGVAGAVVLTSALHRRGQPAWWSGVVALLLVTAVAVTAVVIGSGSVPPR